MIATGIRKVMVKNVKYPLNDMKVKMRNTRKTKCGECIGCTRKNCQQCKNCKDMIKYGGVGRLKKKCVQRICLMQTPDKIVITRETESLHNKIKEHPEHFVPTVGEKTVSPVVLIQCNNNTIEEENDWRGLDDANLTSYIDNIQNMDNDLINLLSCLDENAKDEDIINEAIFTELEKIWETNAYTFSDRNSLLSKMDTVPKHTDITVSENLLHPAGKHGKKKECIKKRSLESSMSDSWSMESDLYLEDHSKDHENSAKRRKILKKESEKDLMLDEIIKDIERFESEQKISERENLDDTRWNSEIVNIEEKEINNYLNDISISL